VQLGRLATGRPGPVAVAGGRFLGPLIREVLAAWQLDGAQLTALVSDGDRRASQAVEALEALAAAAPTSTRWPTAWPPAPSSAAHRRPADWWRWPAPPAGLWPTRARCCASAIKTTPRGRPCSSAPWPCRRPASPTHLTARPATMSRLHSFLTDSRVLSAIGVASLSAIVLLGARALQLAMVWAFAACGLIALAWGAVWLLRRRRARQAGEAIGTLLERQGEAGPGRRRRGRSPGPAPAHAGGGQDHQNVPPRPALGVEALYELPWYITIGNPAAGKSSAIVNSGLTFPFEDGGNAVIKGIGGTRNCDWFFTTEGILLDTAGRYAVHEEDRAEWLGFLDLLKKHRPRAPINGVIVTVSIGELVGGDPGSAIQLAKSLRQRVQELTERLEVFAPVYVLFTKADLIPGFHAFFQDLDAAERDRVWGATLPGGPAPGEDLLAVFDRHFDELHEGLRAISVAQLSRLQGEGAEPGLLTFPAEFAAIRPALRAFVATLFEDNPFQFKPVFRGFYLSSALQGADFEPVSNQHIVRRFGLVDAPAPPPPAGNHGYFLRQLFSKVVFPDRNLVRQHSTRHKTLLRQGAVLASLAVLGLALAGWSWSYLNNRSLLDNVAQDLAKAAKVQEGRIDLQSRLQASRSCRTASPSSSASTTTTRCRWGSASTRAARWPTRCAANTSPAFPA
jgi:type VI secretion system protein ImpL